MAQSGKSVFVANTRPGSIRGRCPHHWLRSALNPSRLLLLATRIALVIAAVAIAIVLMNKAGLAFPVRGVSMLPAIEGGDLAFTMPCSVGNVAPGTVVVYRDYSGKYIIHRVVEASNGYLIVKGDNNPWPDYQHVTARNLVGCVRVVVRGAGWLVEYPTNVVLSAVLLLLFAINTASLLVRRV